MIPCQIRNKKLHCGIYALKNEDGIIQYIGKSKRIEIRIRAYEYKKKCPIHYEILEECEEKDLSEKEQFWIKKASTNNSNLANINILSPKFSIPSKVARG